MTQDISPNSPQAAVADTNAVSSLDDIIVSKVTAMREQTERNLLRQKSEQAETGPADAAADASPVAPDSLAAVPEVADTDDEELVSSNHQADTQDDPVSNADSDSQADELIDFIEFANDNPNAKFKFVRNGQEVVVDAKKAAAILGQGSAIHEDARQLKIERAEFDEYVNDMRSRQEGLTLAMEFTVQPRLREAYDEIVKTQGYQSTFQQQLARTTDPAHIARIQASMQQNEQYIRQQQAVIGQLKPAIDQFRQIRGQQVAERLDFNRRNFTDRELKNEYVYNELRDKIGKVWKDAKTEIIPGIANIDLLSSDENLLSLVRDGLRYRDRPQAKSSGASIAALTQRKGSTSQAKNSNDNIEKLREQANRGDKKAADNLLVARLQSIRASRSSR